MDFWTHKVNARVILHERPFLLVHFRVCFDTWDICECFFLIRTQKTSRITVFCHHKLSIFKPLIAPSVIVLIVSLVGIFYRGRDELSLWQVTILTALGQSFLRTSYISHSSCLSLPEHKAALTQWKLLVVYFSVLSKYKTFTAHWWRENCIQTCM